MPKPLHVSKWTAAIFIASPARRYLQNIVPKFQGSPIEAHEKGPKPVCCSLWLGGLRREIGFL